MTTAGWRTRTGRVDLSTPIVMGIVNVTPDSFSDGGHHLDPDLAAARGLRLVAEGAAVVDVGGESTRPGAEPVEQAEELRRVIPVVEALAAEGVVVSIDTTKPEVAEAACAAGAEIVNDVTGFRSPEMRRVAAETGAGVVVMHMQGTPRTMQERPHYDDVVTDVGRHLEASALAVEAAGVDRRSICVDPGIGFGKTLEHNLALLGRLEEIVALGYPVVVGTSRKSFLGRLLGIDDPVERDRASAVTAALAIDKGARVVRVHNVPLSAEAAQVAWAIVRARTTQQPS